MAMISADKFLDHLEFLGMRFACGIPDSLMAAFCQSLESRGNWLHPVASCEGSAVGLAIGHHLSTGDLPLVYLQNSGLGNIVNPLLSLASPNVYDLPALFLIGWRGELGPNGMQVPDEPQHTQQGLVTLEMLKLIGIESHILEEDNWSDVVELSIKKAQDKKKRIALVAKKQFFAKSPNDSNNTPGDQISREDAVRCVISTLPADWLVISTTGMISRELLEARLEQGRDVDDFLVVGGMGLANQIASGVAMNSGNRPVVCLDGDGALFMRLGGLAVSSKQRYFLHIVFNNEAHDSVGGGKSSAVKINLCAVAEAFGYITIFSDNLYELSARILEACSLVSQGHAVFLEIFVGKGARKNLPRPKDIPVENKIKFMKKVGIS